MWPKFCQEIFQTTFGSRTFSLILILSAGAFQWDPSLVEVRVICGV